jgi:hypothetical protein
MSKIAINENPEFSTDMDALTPNTPAHADYFTVRFPQALNNEKANRRDAKIFDDDVNGGKMRMGMENGHLYYEEL